MMSLLDQYRVNKDSAVNGVEIPIGLDNYLTLAYAGASNTKFAGVLQSKMQVGLAKNKRKRLSVEDDRRILAEAYAECIVLGWRGPDFKDKPFSKEAVVDLFMELPEFFKDVQDLASDMDLFVAEQEEEATKNL